MELSRIKVLVEDIRKLQGENKMLKAKHDRMSKILIREKRQRTKAEADSSGTTARSKNQTQRLKN